MATGIYQGWRETGSLGALTGTGYGRLLIGKLALIAVLLASAGLAHRSLAVAVVRPDSLRRIVEREALLGLGVLSVTSFLVATPPARTTYAPPFVATVQGRDVDGSVIRVVLDVAPTRVGLETIRLHTY